jgi:RHS repeat-associated protein
MNNGSATYTYDAENRITSTAGATYVYDGDGNRVKKSTGTLYFGESFTNGPITETDLSGTIKAEYVYFGGKRIARRDFPGGSVHYYFSDHLKSVNLVYNATGTLEEDSDFYPYGGERAYVAGSGNHFKFTGKERDTESGLDYFGARYYGNSLGRFLTPDWADNATAVPYAEFGDPQSLNLYTYVRNKPIETPDLDGHEGALDTARSFFCSMGASFLCKSEADTAHQEVQNKEKLVKAQDDVMKDDKFKRSPDGTTHCNEATVCQLQKVGAPTNGLTDKKGNPLRAKDIAKALADPKNGYVEVTSDKGQQLANKGTPVVYAGPGHVGLLRPEGVPYDKPQGNPKFPLANDIGANHGVLRMNRVFRKSALPEVKYYVPKGAEK